MSLSSIALWAVALAAPARAADVATLQLIVATPDPVLAGETVTFQMLAVNSGAETWRKGAYHWEVEVYDLSETLIRNLGRYEPDADTGPGGSSAAVLYFQVPETLSGRLLYRAFLVHSGRRLVESEFRGFQVLARRVAKPKPPEPEYHLGGGLTVSYKGSNRSGHSGSTSLNLMGKMKSSTFLLNTYLLHDEDRAIDPYILLFQYYAPWGTVHLGDVAPRFGTLSLAGQTLRGAMLEQEKSYGRWGRELTLSAGRLVDAENGTSAANGRYQRLLYGAKTAVKTPWNLKVGLGYVLGFDDQGSLSTDPTSPDFRGPTLKPEKSPVLGLDAAWEPGGGVTFLAEAQRSSYFDDSGSTRAAISDTAVRAEAKWEGRKLGARAWLQRTGTDFRSFGAPTAVPDRLTTELSVRAQPASWLSVQALLNQFGDNLSSLPGKVTTNQRILSGSGAARLPSGTELSASYGVNSAQGEPRSAQDNRTTTTGLSASQPIGAQKLSVNLQLASFADATKLAHDLDTVTIGASGAFDLGRSRTGGLGLTNSTSKDAVDGSSRKTLSLSASGTAPYGEIWTLQGWGTLSTTKSDSTVVPAETTSLSFTAEATRQLRPETTVTLGLGVNKTSDKLQPTLDSTEGNLQVRVSYSF